MLKVILLFFFLNFSFETPLAPETATVPVRKENYTELCTRMEEKKKEFRTLLKSLPAEQHDSLIKSAHAFLLDAITSDFFSHWYNTPWSFYGQTRTPGKGQIACGYYVTTVLYDAGFRIPRVKWAQLMSETMIKNMTADLRRYRDKPVSELEKYIRSRSDGLYIVGLDNHVGFIMKKGSLVKFVHSNYYQADVGVMAQNLEDDSPLTHSSYRVVGRVLTIEMIRKWILDENFE